MATTLRIQRQFLHYRFKNKNPVIDKMRTVAQDEGLYNKKRRRILSQNTGMAVGTFDGWWDGDTIDPKHKSVANFYASLGYEETWRKTRKINIEEEQKAAAEWRIKENERLERERMSTSKRPAHKSNGKGIHK